MVEREAWSSSRRDSEKPVPMLQMLSYVSEVGL